MSANGRARLFSVGLLMTLGMLSLGVDSTMATCSGSSFGSACAPYGHTIASNLPGASLNGDVVAWQVGEDCPRACYDLRAGVLIASGETTPWWDCSFAPFATDDYQVLGAPAGVPVTFYAEMRVRGTIQGHGEISAWFERGSNSVQQSWYSSAVDSVLAVPLRYLPGEIFTLTAVLAAWGPGGTSPGSATATGEIRFGGLPPRANVVSCQGYDVPVPTRTRTWGRIKAQYR